MIELMQITPLESLSVELSGTSVSHREEPYLLKAGGLSNWYVDLRTGLANGETMVETGDVMAADIEADGIDFEIITAIGVGGWAVLSSVRHGLSKLGHKGIRLAWAVDKHEIDEQGMDQYGLHLPEGYAYNRRFRALDDTASTGSSLITLVGMIREEGGIVDKADVLVDRSKGQAALALAEVGVELRAKLELNENFGMLVPIEQAA